MGKLLHVCRGVLELVSVVIALLKGLALLAVMVIGMVVLVWQAIELARAIHASVRTTKVFRLPSD